MMRHVCHAASVKPTRHELWELKPTQERYVSVFGCQETAVIGSKYINMHVATYRHIRTKHYCRSRVMHSFGPKLCVQIICKAKKKAPEHHLFPRPSVQNKCKIV
jgi:hypothetical protein